VTALIDPAIWSILGGVRMAVAVLGCLLLPGLGWARRLRLRDKGDTLALTVVLSLCSTAIVATSQVVAGWWSPVGGLLALGAIAVLGFVPGRSVVERTGTFLLGPTEQGPYVHSEAAEEEWKDWYADAVRRSDEEHRRRLAEAEAAEQEWKDWYADAVRRSDEERRHREAEGQAAEQEWRDWVDGPRATGGSEVGGAGVGGPDVDGLEVGVRDAQPGDRERTSSPWR
jgi:hypothetical protein